MKEGITGSRLLRGSMRLALANLVALGVCAESTMVAQMIAIESPFNTASHSFYERNGVGFNFRLPGSSRLVGLGPGGLPTPDGSIPFRFGGLGGTLPPFGGYDPSDDTTFGFGYRGRNGGAFDLNFAFGQGSSQTFTSTVPSIVIMNGTTGSVSDTSQRPFVTSVIPVVGRGGENGAPNLRQAGGNALRRQPGHRNPGSDATADTEAYRPASGQVSSAAQGDLSVAEIRRQRQQQQDAAIDKLLGQARSAAASGKPASAKVYYRNALRRAEGGDRHSEILQELREYVANN